MASKIGFRNDISAPGFLGELGQLHPRATGDTFRLDESPASCPERDRADQEHLGRKPNTTDKIGIYWVNAGWPGARAELAQLKPIYNNDLAAWRSFRALFNKLIHPVSQRPHCLPQFLGGHGLSGRSGRDEVRAQRKQVELDRNRPPQAAA